MGFLATFRGQLVVILAVLLVATLGVQYYLNLVAQQENEALREAQSQALVAGITLGFSSIPLKGLRVADLVNADDQTYFDESTRQRIKDIIIVDNQWRITDSLDEEHLPTLDENDKPVYQKLADLTDLPPIMEASRLGADIVHFPKPKASTGAGDPDEAHAVPLETSQGRWYVIVSLRNEKHQNAFRAARPLVYTLGVLLVSSLITLLLVWRFSRPIADLSAAARHIAEGDLGVRVPVTNRNDEMGRLAANFNEMSSELEKKAELEAQLQQAEKSAVVGRLGSAIAHEIRNPLNYINLTLDHLRTKYAPEDADKRENFEKLTSQLKSEVARIDQQISDFLNYSRPAIADLRPISARSVLDESLRLIEPEADDKHVKIGLVEHEEVPEILGDPEFLRSVFNNLFVNAIQAMEPGGGRITVKISPSDDGREVVFEVADTGKGIPHENLEKIFEPYFSTKETGTGLGLAIVQKVVEIHHGSIAVTSASEKGTTFTVNLPAAGRK
ncbi:MAG: HAMP domain-containing protein [Acidobacteria bacterium]|nr:HAMP domain-containing protein [Acidobacteriota bacterium]MCW5948615.1 HAMP domain-containing protein [Pyrinomonadaceae bacterium]